MAPSFDVEQNRLLLLPLFLFHFLKILLPPLCLFLSPSLDLKSLGPYWYFSDPNSLPFYGYLMAFSGGQSGRSVNLTTYHHVVPRLSMNWAVSLLHVYVCMAWRGQNVPEGRATIIIELVTSHKLCVVILVNWILFYIWLQFPLYLMRIYDSENKTHSSKLSNSLESRTCFTPVDIK
jgi:hypothetical protein